MQGISLSINRLRNFYCNNSRGILESLGFNLWKLYSISLRAANNKLSTTGVSYLDLANLKMAKSKLAMCLLPEATANVLSFYQVMRQASDWATNECQEPGSLRMPVSPYRWIKELAFWYANDDWTTEVLIFHSSGSNAPHIPSMGYGPVHPH